MVYAHDDAYYYGSKVRTSIAVACKRDPSSPSLRGWWVVDGCLGGREGEVRRSGVAGAYGGGVQTPETLGQDPAPPRLLSLSSESGLLFIASTLFACLLRSTTTEKPVFGANSITLLLRGPLTLLHSLFPFPAAVCLPIPCPANLREWPKEEETTRVLDRRGLRRQTAVETLYCSHSSEVSAPK